MYNYNVQYDERFGIAVYCSGVDGVALVALILAKKQKERIAVGKIFVIVCVGVYNWYMKGYEWVVVHVVARGARL